MNPNDLRIHTYHEKPQGSWSFNMPTGVHIIHIPTGLEAKCHKHRSQHMNKEEAMLELEILLEELGGHDD